jgi:carboxypeptidase family protein
VALYAPAESGFLRPQWRSKDKMSKQGNPTRSQELKGELSMRYKFRGLLMIVTVLMLIARMSFPAFAQQSPTGSIRGTVTDPQGAVITNATVTVTNKATGDTRKVSTGGDGIYLVSTLLPGEYEVKIEASGFSTHVLSTTVEVGRTSPGDAALRVGAASEIVDVVSEAPIIDKSNYKIDGVVTRQKIDSLPLNGRNFLQLALLEPGVSVSVSSPGNANNLFNVSIGGASAAVTRITVDGGSVLDPVTGGAAQNFSTETIQEFQISTFNFDLSTGVTSVGAVNIVSRTGTNAFHGSALLFARDDQWAAVPTLQQGAPDFRRYQYGGSIGGPIKKDRAFFFGNVEWLDQDAVFSTVNTGFAGFRQLDNITGSPYDGVLANVRGDFKINDKNNLFTRYSFDDNDTFGPVDNNTLPSNWRVNSNRDHNLQGGLTTILTQNFVNDLRFNYQRIQNDSLLPGPGDCPAGNPGCIGLGGAQVRVLGSAFIAGNNVNAPQNRILDRYQTSDNLNWQKGAHRIRFGGEWEHNYGKGGWAFLEPALVVLHDPAVVQFVNAQIAGAPLPTALKAALTIPLPAVFSNPSLPVTLADVLQLPIAVALIGLGNPEQPPAFNQLKARQSNRYRFYGQDSWLVRSGLTFNFGASYLYETNLFNHDLGKPELLRPLIGDLEPSAKDRDNIAPAIGFAWDVGNTGKTVVRGGAGMYYDTSLFVTRLRERALLGPLGNGRVQLTGAFYRNNIQFPTIPPLPGAAAVFNLINPPLGAAIDFQTIPTKFTGQNFLDLLNSQNPQILAQLSALGGAGVQGISFFKTGTDLLDPGNVTPYSLHYNIGLQRQLPHNMAITADFVLRQSRHSAIVNNDYNLFNRAASKGGPVIRRCVGAAEATNPAVLCSNGPISFIQFGGRQAYKALLVKLEKRFSNRLQFTTSYALSEFEGFFTGEDLENTFGNSGDLGSDARHSLTFSGIVDLPYGIQASLISVVRSAAPFNARVPTNIDLNGDGTKNDTLPGLEINSLNRGTSKDDLRRLVNEFNLRFAGKPDANGVTIPTLVLPRNFNFPDRFQSHDLRFSKTVKFGEKYSLQGLVEVFNVLNNANLLIGGGQSTRETIGPAFGQFTERVGQSFGTGGPRAVQVGAYFRF